MIISLERAGKFHAVTMRPNDHKCAAMRTRTYQYNVKIEAMADKLSPEGYLMNNERIGGYFDGRFGQHAPQWDAVSCEHMAIAAAKEIADMLIRDLIDVQCVECQILGSNGALIKATWRKPSPISQMEGLQ